jgi:branched-chain amino acid transport system permease protein
MDFFWHFVITVCTYIPNILGFNLIFGKGKILHFGPLGVSTMAAYGTFITVMATGSYPLGLLVGLAGALAVSMVFALLSLRLEPDAFGVIAIAVHLGLLTLVLNWQSLTRGALGIPRIPRFAFLSIIQDFLHTTPIQTFTLLSFVVCVVWTTFLWFLDRGPIGRRLAALAEHGWHAASLGIVRLQVHVLVFACGAVGALLTNVLYHQYVFLLHPSDLGFPAFIFFITVVVAGRPGSVVGTIIACTLLLFLREGMRFLPIAPTLIGPVRLILFGLILFAAVWWRRDVLFPKQRVV